MVSNRRNMQRWSIYRPYLRTYDSGGDFLLKAWSELVKKISVLTSMMSNEIVGLLSNSESFSSNSAVS